MRFKGRRFEGQQNQKSRQVPIFLRSCLCDHIKMRNSYGFQKKCVTRSTFWPHTCMHSRDLWPSFESRNFELNACLESVMSVEPGMSYDLKQFLKKLSFARGFFFGKCETFSRCLCRYDDVFFCSELIRPPGEWSNLITDLNCSVRS